MPEAGSPRLRLDVPSEVLYGATVPMTLRVENPGDRPVDLYLRGRTIAFDVIVADGDGAVIWRRLDGEVIPAILRLETLAPRGVLELRAEWNQRTSGGRAVAAGLYVVRGVLLTESETPFASRPERLRILPAPA